VQCLAEPRQRTAGPDAGALGEQETPFGGLPDLRHPGWRVPGEQHRVLGARQPVNVQYGPEAGAQQQAADLRAAKVERRRARSPAGGPAGAAEPAAYVRLRQADDRLPAAASGRGEPLVQAPAALHRGRIGDQGGTAVVGDDGTAQRQLPAYGGRRQDDGAVAPRPGRAEALVAALAAERVAVHGQVISAQRGPGE
jgi:hypothetical protein